MISGVAEIKKYDVVIVGAGMAGMTAAIYARRAGKSVAIFENKVHGGQIINAPDVENWPGEERISGADLMKKIYHQMNKESGAKLDVYDKEVVRVRDTGMYKEVLTPRTKFLAESLILATGTIDRKLELPHEKDLVGHGISYCAVCDGALFKGKNVAVIGGGNTALNDALYLANLAKKVYLVHRRPNILRADEELVSRARQLGNIEFVLGARPAQILGEEKVEGLIVQQKSPRQLPVEGIFVAIGRVPATDQFADMVKIDRAGYIIAGEDCKTTCPGIFVAGDCRTKKVRQLVTAAGDGAVAATAAVEYVNSRRPQ